MYAFGVLFLGFPFQTISVTIFCHIWGALWGPIWNPFLGLWPAWADHGRATLGTDSVHVWVSVVALPRACLEDPLGLPWALLGPLLGPLGATLKPILGPFSALVGPAWAHPGLILPSTCACRLLCALFGTIKGPCWAIVSPSVAILGYIIAVLGLFRALTRPGGMREAIE